MARLANFGDKAWPRGTVLAIQKDMSFPRLQAVVIELAGRLAGQVAVQAQDGARHDVNADAGPLPGYALPEYATTTRLAAPLLPQRERLRLPHRRCPQPLSSAHGQCTTKSNGQRQ